MRAAALALAATIVALTCAATAPNVPIYRSVPNEEKKIALTFDDGPHPHYTEQILDLLDRYGVKATFFVIGENIEYYDKGIISRIIDSGHEIGNHTFSHTHVKQTREESFRGDVRKCHKIMLERYGYEMKLFRPPEGAVDAKVQSIARELGYSIILWSIDTRDWEHTAPTLIVSNVEKNIDGGDIILMHDYVSKPNTTTEALRELIPRLISEGYEFVTVSDLIKTK